MTPGRTALSTAPRSATPAAPAADRPSLPRAGHRPDPGHVEVWQLLVDPAQTRAAEQLLGTLDPQETERLGHCGAVGTRDTVLVSHVALRLLLGAQLGVAPQDVQIERAPCPGCGEPHGRPVVRTDRPLHFSLSHTTGLVVCAFATEPVGADAEALASVPGTELVHLLHPSEQEAIAALPPARRSLAFLHCWVRKEAYLKGTGHGLSAGLDSVAVGLGTEFGSSADDPAGWRLAAVPAPDGYAVAVALRDAEQGTVARRSPWVRLRRADLTAWTAR